MSSLSFSLQSLPIHLITPRTLSLVFFTLSTYHGLITPLTFERIYNPRQKLKIWRAAYEIGNKLFGGCCILGTISGLITYKLTKNKYFLIGSGLFALLMPYTYLLLRKINNELTDIDNKSGLELTADDYPRVMKALNDWYLRHKPRIIISFIASILFYLGEATVVNNKIIEKASKIL